MPGLVGSAPANFEGTSGRLRLPAFLCSRLDTRVCYVRACWDGPEDLTPPGKIAPGAPMTHFPFIEIIPQSVIQDFIERDETSPPGSRESRWSVRKSSCPFKEFAIDSSNRISLNAALRFHLGLLPDDDILVIGMEDYLELWNSRHYSLAEESYLMSA